MLLAVPTHYGEAADCIYWQDVAWQLVREIIAREEWKSHHRGVYEEPLDNIYKSRLDGLHESIRLYKHRTVSQQLAVAHPELSAAEIFKLAKKQIDENHE